MNKLLFFHLPPPLGHEIIYLCQAVYEYYVHHHQMVDDKEINHFMHHVVWVGKINQSFIIHLPFGGERRNKSYLHLPPPNGGLGMKINTFSTIHHHVVL